MSQDGSSTTLGPDESPDAIVERLNAMVGELLGRPIGPDDNYFTAGLDSATVVKLHTLMTHRLQILVPVMALFRNPTLRRTAAVVVAARAALARDKAAGRPASTPLPVDGGRHPLNHAPEPTRRAASSRREIRDRIRRDGATR